MSQQTQPQIYPLLQQNEPGMAMSQNKRVYTTQPIIPEGSISITGR